MKKNKYMYLLAAVLGLGVSACSNDELLSEGEKMQTDGAPIMFTSTIAERLDMLDVEGEKALSTRSVITDGQISDWSKGDAVAISDGLLYYSYRVKDDAMGTSCSFEVEEGGIGFTGNETVDGRLFYAFYPEKAITEAAGRGGWDESTVKAMIFAEQDNEENLDGGAFGAYMASEPARMTAGDVSFTFHLVSSVIDIDISGFDKAVKTVSVKSNSGVSLAGLLMYDCERGTAEVSVSDKTDYAASTQSDVVTVGNIAAGATTVRLYVLPVMLEGGVTITVQDVDNVFYTKTASANVGNKAETGLTSLSGVAGATVCKPYYKKYRFGSSDTAKKNRWMSALPGNTLFHLLSIPGAHDAATSSVSSLKAQSQTQSKDVNGLLEAGVRGFDVRPGYKGSGSLSELTIYHGTVSTGVKFNDFMDALVAFAKANKGEAVFVTMQKEGNSGTTDLTPDWRRLVREYIEAHADAFVREVTPGMTLADCRGKIVLVSRTPYGSDDNNWSPVYGALTWNNDWPGGSEEGKDVPVCGANQSPITTAYVQDAYESPDNKEKYVGNTLTKSAADLSSKWYFNLLLSDKTF